MRAWVCGCVGVCVCVCVCVHILDEWLRQATRPRSSSAEAQREGVVQKYHTNIVSDSEMDAALADRQIRTQEVQKYPTETLKESEIEAALAEAKGEIDSKRGLGVILKHHIERELGVIKKHHIERGLGIILKHHIERGLGLILKYHIGGWRFFRNIT